MFIYFAATGISPDPLALARVLRHQADDLHGLRVPVHQEHVVVQLPDGVEAPLGVVDADQDCFQLEIEVDAAGGVVSVARD